MQHNAESHLLTTTWRRCRILNNTEDGRWISLKTLNPLQTVGYYRYH